MKVGISILTHEGHNVWNNGIGQNIYFLAKCIDAIPFVETVYIIDCGNQSVPPAFSGSLGDRFQLISLADAASALDIAIEMGGALDAAWKLDFRSRGKRIVYHNCGQPYSALIEPPIFSKPGCFTVPDLYDEVWLLPKDGKFAAMQRSIHRCPVAQVPYLWGPDFLVESGLKQTAEPFGYKPGSMAGGKMRPAIFEPNISPIKMGIIPLMICEELERLCPELLESVEFMNGAHMGDALTFNQLTTHLDLQKANKLKIKAREYFSDVMKSGANMVISHQIDVEQNYLYLDTIYGNYPLIHNSPQFSDVGYYYQSSNIEAAVKQVLSAALCHDEELPDYTSKSRAKISSVDPLNPSNRNNYARRLLHVLEPARSREVQAA